jgi:hypothetical protein
MYDSFQAVGCRYVPSKFIEPCNSLQDMDNLMDPVYITFIHAQNSGIQFTKAFLEVPVMDFVESLTSILYVATVESPRTFGFA